PSPRSPLFPYTTLFRSLVLQVVEGAREGRALAVELVDEHRPRLAELVGHAPDDLGLHFHAFDRGDDEHDEVGGPERARYVTDKVDRKSTRLNSSHLVIS